MMRRTTLLLIAMAVALAIEARTLIVYYSYTNNVETIAKELHGIIDSDMIEIEPAQKGLDYAANNYAIGSAQISAIRNKPDDAASYPAIDPVNVDLSKYDCIIIGAPLWWSQMAAPLQTFLFQHGKDMAGKNIGLIVSSASSGIGGVESDARRLIPGGRFISPSLWIRSAQTSSAKSLLDSWLKAIDYSGLTAGVESAAANTDITHGFTVYSLSGVRLMADSPTLHGLRKGIYIVNGKKTYINK